MDEWMMDGWVVEWVGGWIGEWMDGLGVGGWMDGQKSGSIWRNTHYMSRIPRDAHGTRRSRRTWNKT